MAQYTKHTLAGGVRLITIPRLESPSVMAMVVVPVGSRYEGLDNRGVAHFVEHMAFKGTKKRPQRGQIAYEIESIGGETNAATSSEFTYYYAKSAPEQLSKILDVVLDMATGMTFPKPDFEIERGNILEEMRLLKDTPPRYLLKKFDEFIFDQQPISNDPLGNESSIKNMQVEQLFDFVSKGYARDNLLVVVAGNFVEDETKKQIESFFVQAELSDKSKLTTKAYVEGQVKPRVFVIEQATQQAHVCFGVKTFGYRDERKYALGLVNAILGDGLSSRLITKIRDELGLAYYVSSTAMEDADGGAWLMRAGVDLTRIEPAIKACLHEWRRLRDGDISESDMRKAKDMVKGSTMINLETSEEQAMWYGFQELEGLPVLTPEEFMAKIEAVTKDEMLAVCKDVLVDAQLNLGILGPFKTSEKFEELCTLE